MCLISRHSSGAQERPADSRCTCQPARWLAADADKSHHHLSCWCEPSAQTGTASYDGGHHRQQARGGAFSRHCLHTKPRTKTGKAAASCQPPTKLSNQGNKRLQDRSSRGDACGRGQHRQMGKSPGVTSSSLAAGMLLRADRPLQDATATEHDRMQGSNCRTPWPPEKHNTRILMSFSMVI